MIQERKTILFVDDEPWLQEALIESLLADGFDCISTSDMTEAWGYLKQGEVSVLVSDIMMPPGDSFSDVDSSGAGFSLVDKVCEEYPNVSIICLSVIGDQKLINILKKKGVLYLRKGETPLETAVNLIKSRATGYVRYGERK